MTQKDFICHLGQFRKNAKGRIPSQKESYAILERIVQFLFPIFSERLEVNLQNELECIQLDLKHLLISVGYSAGESEVLVGRFVEELPGVYQLLLKDADAIYNGDPAAESIEEVVVSYPGFYAILVHRIAHQLYKQKVPILPRLFSEFAHKDTGIDIHPGARIGGAFCIDHGTGIVIGETSEIGNNVKIYQGVTLGALSVHKSVSGQKRHPKIEDEVTIYAGSTILGGDTVIGRKTVIGGNVWLTESVDAYAVVLNKSDVFVKNKNPEYDKVIDFVI
jgi:serine O-acetyltransferase